MPAHRWSPTWKILAILGSLALILVVILLGNRLWIAGPNAAEVQQLIHDKNVALGYLENQEIEKAAAAFQEIAVRLPDDPLPWRNLAVVRVLALGEHGVEATPAAVQAATAALEEVERREGVTSNSNWLRSQVATAAGDVAAAQAFLDAVLKVEPNSAEAWFAKFHAAEMLGAPEAGPAAIVYLQRACENRPENAWLRVEWLATVGAELVRLPAGASGGDESDSQANRFGNLAEQLSQSRASIEPFAPIIKIHTKVDVLALLGEARQAAGEKKWRETGLKMITIGNVLRPHAVLDRILVQRHPLEFVATEFQPDVTNIVPTQAAEAAIPFAFVEKAIDEVTSQSDQSQITTKDVTDVELADFDLDGRLDIVVLLPGRVTVWSRGSAGESWQEIAFAEVSGADHVIVQDLDADFDEAAGAVHQSADVAKDADSTLDLRAACPTADVDMVLYGQGGVKLLENVHRRETNSRTLVAVNDDKVPAALNNVIAATVADLEGDGDLDLVFGAEGKLHRWINGGELRFHSAAADPRPDVTQVLALDLDRDVDIDILIASSTEAGWLENLRHGQFRWRSFRREMPDLDRAHALEVIDVDGNASWDLVGATPGGLKLVATLTPEPGNVRQWRSSLLAKNILDGLLPFDHANDGHDDLLSWSADGVKIVQYTPGGDVNRRQWTVLTPEFPTVNKIQAASCGDLDHDGDLDAVFASPAGVTAIMNEGGNRNHWVEVALQAQQIKGQQISPSGRVSPYGIGSLLELKAGARYQARVVRGQTTHFGLGQNAQADVIRVLWLNGIPHNIIRPAAREFVCEPQVLNTSCPYLYAWNGEAFEFVTDLLWNAPLGLQLSEGVLAPPRAWEYVKIPGESLKARNGHYVLQVTEELWEAVYFDEVRLIAVDHPADSQVFSNEKVGPPEIAAHKIHTVLQPRLPKGAKNHHGRDLLSDLAKADGEYARVHERKLRQGVVEESYLDLDLGTLDGTGQVTLFLTGWVYPSATSINVALSQGGTVAPPKPPSLHVPDGQGSWREAMPFMGFPGGKTKTIAIDLSEVLVKSDPRIRIATTMELYWDQAFFTVDEPTAPVLTHDLPLVSADLHFRGFSKVIPDSENGPEHFLYGEVSRTPKWPPMPGAFTRLGDVKELLKQSDDRLLVMGAGDEVTLHFRVPDQLLRAGWKRDFLLYSTGWEKDCNLLTVLGQSVEPLPFQSMKAYPSPVGESTPDSQEFADYLRRYQTRHQRDEFWRALSQLPAPPRPY